MQKKILFIASSFGQLLPLVVVPCDESMAGHEVREAVHNPLCNLLQQLPSSTRIHIHAVAMQMGISIWGLIAWTKNNKVACVISFETALCSAQLSFSLSFLFYFSFSPYLNVSLHFSQVLLMRACVCWRKDCSCWSVKLLEQQQWQQRCIIKIYHTHRWRWQIVELRQRRQATTDKRQTTTGSNGLWTEDMEQTTELVRQSVRRGGRRDGVGELFY